MSTRGIVPVTLSLTQGDFFTLWAPTWREHGAEWQAFLGDDSGVFLFPSPAHLLAFLTSGQPHDLTSHPDWKKFAEDLPSHVVPSDKDYYDVIGAPAFLADRPSHVPVSAVAGVFRIARSLAEVSSADAAVLFFASHSILGNVSRGAEHFAGSAGLSEWTAVGRVVYENWEKVVHSLDDAVKVIPEDTVSAEELSAAEAAIADAQERAEAERKRHEEERKKKEQQSDPYDSTPWATAGIDPVSITIDSTTLYTLRTYVDGAPVFLGRFSEIFTFPSGKTLVRWIIDHDEHDMAQLSTWPDLVTAANSGELELTVHPDNAYSFTGISRDIRVGVNAVDTRQMAQAYELMADAADWAGDDSLNSFFLAHPRMQNYISYMVGSAESSGYVPSPPFTEHAEDWQELESILTKRFSRS